MDSPVGLGQCMLVDNWLLGKNVESVDHMDSTLAMGQWMLVVDWLLGRKVESVDHIGNTIAGSMNVRS
jgi:hypothetical protein